MNSIGFNPSLAYINTSSPIASATPASVASVPQESPETQAPAETFSMSSASSVATPEVAMKPVTASETKEIPQAVALESVPEEVMAFNETPTRASGVTSDVASSALPSTVGTAVSASSDSISGTTSVNGKQVSNSHIQFYKNAMTHEPEITSVVQGFADELGMGTEGIQYRLKSWDSFSRKIDGEMKKDPNYEVRDLIRYTLTASPEELTQKALSTMKRMEEAGYKTTVVKNSWDDTTRPYKGINTTVESPDGVKFEIQYHTPESYAMKDKTHKLYEEERVLDPRSPRALELQREQMAMSASLHRPDGVEQIVSKNDYK
ncbi:hypothetical protein IJJ97_01790 [bacterium]|nr:hypothetical protein [bacterium]